MKSSTVWISAYDFYKATGLNEKAREKFDKLGFINPKFNGWEFFYSTDDVELVNAMRCFMDGTTDVTTAYEKAREYLATTSMAA